MHELGMSLMRCDGGVQSVSGFFYRAGLTYQKCFTAYDPLTCAEVPASGVVGPIAEGALMADEPADESTAGRTFAVVLPNLKEGAWQLFVPENGLHFCLGRGTVTETATCRMNVCTQTPNYITIGAVAPGGDCYHTCYHVQITK